MVAKCAISAAVLGTCRMTVLRLIRAGTLNARQACKGSPWVIKARDLEAVKTARGRPVNGYVAMNSAACNGENHPRKGVEAIVDRRSGTLVPSIMSLSWK